MERRNKNIVFTTILSIIGRIGATIYRRQGFSMRNPGTNRRHGAFRIRTGPER